MTHRSHSADLVTIATFNAVAPAKRLKSWLEGKHIPAEIQDETRLQRFWFFATPKAGIHVQTTKDHFEQVRALIRENDALDSLGRAIHCPSCGSLRVQYPDLTRKNLLPTLAAQLLVLLRITRHKYYCEDCHFTWPGAETRSHKKPKHVSAG